ncbi:MAG TPA: prepilin-type N-terminal cleavage/methylation domain-containing protein [Candidatus Pacearchaeota archaeon]|nr:prepilin-type N-terminal cleavage/methylation domain-containing protein [Candidatus Parcubacteria bacterium]HNP79468.1 prepilin-type N-terminal cleavage/methylation domain-containing protein [Candidatus Pacearchaeota archaeon]HOC53552.1 prepilin-type N-terminal cleavage/methylation domain-containing protein [Candidatus Pacearchaeota archaeon]
MKKQQSFTLIEILLAIVIVGILSGFVILRSSESTTTAELAKAKAFNLSLLTSLPAHFVSQWKFDGPNSSGVATANEVKDTWGPNDGTVNGSPTIYTGTNCISGNCLSFNGSTDYINCGTNASLDIVGPITISAWVKTSNTIRQAVFSNTGAGPSYPGFAFGVGFDELGAPSSGQVAFFTESGLYKIANKTVNNDKWRNIVATNDNTNTSFYIDGTLSRKVAQGAATTNTGGNKYIGMILSTHYYSGLLDEITIYNDSLSISKIQENYYADLNKGLKNRNIAFNEYIQRIGELQLNLTKNE